LKFVKIGKPISNIGKPVPKPANHLKKSIF
jgi:hypothetical protein